MTRISFHALRNSVIYFILHQSEITKLYASILYKALLNITAEGLILLIIHEAQNQNITGFTLCYYCA